MPPECKAFRRAGSVAQGALNVRTFNNGDQVGVIDLQNKSAGTGNSMGPITLEARLAGSTNPPPYAQSNIDYRSINGTSISGIGTAADFSLVAPSQTIDLAPGTSLSGTNVSLIATAGDVTVKSAITNAQVNGGQAGGSLNLYATGNIMLNNPGGNSAGVVIGKDLGTLDPLGNRQYEKFDHTLTLVATGDIRIYRYGRSDGRSALRANASAAEACRTRRRRRLRRGLGQRDHRGLGRQSGRSAGEQHVSSAPRMQTATLAGAEPDDRQQRQYRRRRPVLRHGPAREQES